MSGNGKSIWIEEGYACFARGGRSALRVEVMSQKTGISKSSFYHHFADTDVFMEHLLNLHRERALVMAEKERRAASIDPELIQILVDHKTDLMFSRQLRLANEVPQFAQTLSKTQQDIGRDFVKLWARELVWKGSIVQLEVLFSMALENFFLQITPERLEASWLREYFSSLQEKLRVFQS